MNENHWNGGNPKQLTIMIVQKDVGKPAFSCFSGVGTDALEKRGQFHINVNTHLLYYQQFQSSVFAQEKRKYTSTKRFAHGSSRLSLLLALNIRSARRSTPSRKWVLLCEPGKRLWAQMRFQLLPTPCSQRDPGQGPCCLVEALR